MANTVVLPYESRDADLSALNSFLNKETVRYEFDYNPVRDSKRSLSNQEITEEEKILVEEKESTFPDELRFSVKVDLLQSKQAYLAFINGLNDEQSQSTLMDLYPHDPHTYPCPIGDIDFSFLAIDEDVTHRSNEEGVEQSVTVDATNDIVLSSPGHDKVTTDDSGNSYQCEPCLTGHH